MTDHLVVCPRGHQTAPAGSDGSAGTCPVCGEPTAPVSATVPAGLQETTVAPPASGPVEPDRLREGFDTRPVVADPNATIGLSPTTTESLHLDEPKSSPDANSLSGAVPGYELGRVLGRGSMGIVYQARQVKLNRPVALKMVLAGGHASADDRVRFQKEAEALAAIQHPNIIPVYEVGEAGGLPFFSMEFLPGGTLEKLTRGGTPVGPKVAAAVVEKLARAMHVAHTQGIVHRDLKPGNVLLTADGEPKVTDFGLAKWLDATARPGSATRTGTAMGTPSYMAPEQAEGRIRDIGPAADVYALGAILYELVTGRPPFKGETAVDTMIMVVTEEPVPPMRLNPRLPVDISTVCLKCLQKPIGKRYPTALALADDLRRFQDGEPIHAVPVGNWERLVKWAARRPATAALVAFSAAACVAVFAVGLTYHLRLRESVRETRAEERVAVGRLARLHVAQGMTFVDSGDTPLALPYLIEALKLEQDDPARETRDRIRLAAVLKLCPRLLRVEFHAAAVTDTGYSPDGRFAYSASADGSVHVWAEPPDAATADVRTRFDHGAAVNRAAFSRDVGTAGRLLGTAGADGTAKLWDAASGRLLHTLQHGADVRCVGFDPAGKIALTGGADGAVKLWDTATGNPVGNPLKHGKNVWWATFSPDGTRVVSAGSAGAKLWSAHTGNSVGDSFHAGAESVLYAEFRPDGKQIVTAGEDNVAHLWDVTPTGATHAGRAMAHTEDVLVARFNRTGTRVATASVDGTARLWDLDGNPVGQMMWHNSVVTDVAFAPDGTGVVTASDDNAARVWDAVTGLPAGPRLAHCGGVVRAAFSPDSRSVLSGARSGLTRVYKRLDNYPKIAIKAPPAPDRSPTRSRDGKWDATWGPDGTLRVTDAATHAPAGPVIRPRGNVFTVDFAPDGGRLVTADAAATATIWDVRTGLPAIPPLKHSSAVYAATFNADGTRVVTGSDDNTARVWDATTGAPVGQPMRHDATVNRVVFHPAGEYVLTAASDGSARAWYYPSGEPLTPPLDQDGWVSEVFRTPFDGKVWNLAPERRPLDVLTLEAHWLSGHTVDADGGAVPSGIATLRELWTEVRTRHPEFGRAP